MSCGGNPALKSLNTAKGTVLTQIDAGRSMFNSAKSTIDGTLSTVTSTVTGVIATAQTALDGVLSTVQGTLDGLMAKIPNVTRMADAALSLVGASAADIAAFAQKWEGAAGFDQVYSHIQAGPDAYASWLSSIDPCKDLPNSTLDNDSGVVVQQPPEAPPPSVKPEPPAKLEPVVESAAEQESTGPSTVVESEIRKKYNSYTRQIEEVSGSLSYRIYGIKVDMAAAKKSPEYQRAIEAAATNSMSASEYIQTSSASESDIKVVSNVEKSETVLKSLSLVKSNLNLYENDFRELVGRRQDIPETFHDTRREYFVENKYAALFDRTKQLVEQNSAMLQEYYDYIGAGGV